MWPLYRPSRLITQDETSPVLREGAVSYVDGKPVKAAGTVYKIVCTWQPVTGRQLLLVPEADRFKEQWNVWTDNAQSKGVLSVNDKIARMGRVLVVQEAQFWGSYTMARAMVVDVGPDLYASIQQAAIGL